VLDTFVFDVDGTLVDTNYHHAIAWFRAFRRFDLTPPLWRIHRAIGMGGDKLVGAVAGDDVEKRFGDDIRDGWAEEYAALMGEVRPFEGARALLEEVRKRHVGVVFASSGPADHVEHYVDLLDARSIAQDWTTAEDAEESKPAPDLVQIAMAKVDAGSSILLGDSTWDAEAAKNAGIPVYAVRTGGFSVDELEEAGARRVYESLDEIRGDLDRILGDH
jgi:HAD superfamily hydrolase (TIGR01549 family)